MSIFIGNLGESQVINFLKEHGFSHIFVFQNNSGHGLDVVALRKYKDIQGNTQRILLSIEVKTTTTDGSGPRLSKPQKNPYLNTGKILMEAATGTGRFVSVNSHLQKAAKYLFSAVASGIPMYQAHVRLKIGKGATSSTTTHTKRVRVHGFGNKSKKPLYDSKIRKVKR